MTGKDALSSKICLEGWGQGVTDDASFNLDFWKL